MASFQSACVNLVITILSEDLKIKSRSIFRNIVQSAWEDITTSTCLHVPSECVNAMAMFSNRVVCCYFFKEVILVDQKQDC